MKVKLYSTDCPRCKVLKKKLEEKNIQYTEINSLATMQELNIQSIPMLLIDDTPPLLNFMEALKWMNNLEV